MLTLTGQKQNSHQNIAYKVVDSLHMELFLDNKLANMCLTFTLVSIISRKAVAQYLVTMHSTRASVHAPRIVTTTL